jgi:glutamyl-tRNA synthetase
MSNPVRVRFAPSPTGHLHIGGLRTALFNWLFARHNRGKFLIRVEDTDIERSRVEYVESQLASLAWCNLNADEPIVFQSQRFAEYNAVAELLLNSDRAYRCYCTQEAVRTRVGKGLTEEGEEYYFYDGYCRSLTEKFDKPYVIRMRVPRNRDTIQVVDLIRGTLEFPLSTIDDFVLVRSTGAPMYNFTVVVDDAYMGITHIIRGDEHLVNAPRQLLIYEAAGFAAPHFAHVPLILGRDGKKLSKRDAATAVSDYRTQGILAEALCNYLVRLGWAHGNQEIFTRAELIDLFSLKQVGVKAAIFDTEKLLWMNSVYLKDTSPEVLYSLIVRDIDPTFRSRLSNWSDTQLFFAIGLYKQRCQSLQELAHMISALSVDPQLDLHATILINHKISADLLQILERLSTWDSHAIKDILQSYIKQSNLSFADIAMPMRYALTGNTQAPSVGDLLELLGPEVSLRRLRIILTT